MKIELRRKAEPLQSSPRYPGIREAVDGSTATVLMETAASEGAGAYPITPSTQMGEGWAAAYADGKPNVFGRRLLFFEPEGEHAAAAVTAGMSMMGLRAANFSSGQGIAYMHESLYPAVGKRLTYVLNVACRAMTKHSLNVHAGHDDYHAVDDTGFFQLFAKDVQGVADLTLVAHRLAELALNPGIVAQDGFLTSHVIESVLLPERELVKEYLGDPSDIIDSPTPAQRLVFGSRRRRIPEMFDLDYPVMFGVVQNQDSYAQGVAAQRPYYFDHVVELADRALAEFEALTGRRYLRASGYRIEDADYVLAGQGSVVANAEAVADHLRETRGLKIGVLDLTMFRPFPADLVTRMLAGKKGVTVLERVDQPLAVDPPLLREIRAALSQGVENGRAAGQVPYPGLAALPPEAVPDFYSACFGMGSRDIQPGDLVAAAENMVGGARRRQFYLGIDFVRPDTRLPKLQIWQQRLLDEYPRVADLALAPAGDLNLLPTGSISFRIHSVGGWGAITMGKNLCLTAFELLGLHVKANPKYGSEKKGQPTTFYGTLSREPIKLNCELRHVDVVLSPDPNVFRHSNPLAGLASGGAFVIQSELEPEALWASLPASARAEVREKQLRVFTLDAFSIATAEATDPELRYRMQGAAFMGAFFRVSPLREREGLDESQLFDGVRVQLQKKFGYLGERVVEDNLRVIRRGFDEMRAVAIPEAAGETLEALPAPKITRLLDVPTARDGIGHPGRFWEQVCFLYKTGQDVLADPFVAISAIPAATSSIRDMTDIRFEVPQFIPANCTGCAHCWTQCPDAAIPGVVNTVEEILDAGIAEVAADGVPVDRLRQISKPLARECRRLLGGVPFTSFGAVLSPAYRSVADKLGWDPERRMALDREFASVYAGLADFPLAKTAPFFVAPEKREPGTGGLLSITVNPEACKGCNLCVAVCPDHALVTVRQDEDVSERLRRNWKLWQRLPDTNDRYINIASLDEGIGVLSSLLLKKQNYRSMVGGDGACMGCGEKTAVHLILSAVHALIGPRVKKHVAHLDQLMAGLDRKARELLASEADLGAAAGGDGSGAVTLPLGQAKRQRVERISQLMARLKDLRWRYTEGPSGKGRAALGMANSTGCSTVWGSTYPYNPYPFPWVNHLFQDSPSVAIGIFEGHMRKMADSFLDVRRAELELTDAYDAAVHEPAFAAFDWRQFTDAEFALCPPIIAMGGDGAMLDIGFQNLSRLMASGKPIRAIVLDTQVYSNTGGQACTSGYTGQVSDMAAYGAARHGKEEVRKELSLIALAHRGIFVHQSSQALASHLLAGVLKGLGSRRPALFNIYTPCPVEHGLADDAAEHAARLALESRAFAFMTFDPDAGATLAECLSLDGNPSPDQDWPTYELTYVDEGGETRTLELPLTIADWAATEGRFRKHFKRMPPDQWNEDTLPFHEYLQLPADEREGKVPFLHTLGADKHLERLRVSPEIVRLAEERLLFWSQLRQLAGLEVAPPVRETVAAELEADFEKKSEALRAEYEAKLADLRTRYPQVIARKLAEGLMRAADGQSVSEVLARVQRMPDLAPVTGVARPETAAALAPTGERAGSAPAAAARSVGAPTAAASGVSAALATAPAAVAAAEETIALEPYIDSELCTTCNECTNLNPKLFAYNENKQAYIKDPRAGTFRELVLAAEKCTVGIIHPGTPLNPNEKDLRKWIERAKRFN